jgi:CheY-like chemotaxis protein
MGGEIGFENGDGVGARFRFELPLTEALGPGPIPAEGSLAGGRCKRVLIVEDNPVNLLIARKMLEKLGHAAASAAKGAEALAVLEEEAFDMVVMDCQMPEMDGFEATRRIRSSGRPWNNIPIIAMTAHAMAGDRERCLAAGMTDDLLKPFNLADLPVLR